MDVQFACTSCSHPLTATTDLAGTAATCPSCRTPLVVPGQTAASDPLDMDHGDVFSMDDTGGASLESTIKTVAGQFETLDYHFLLPFATIFSPALLRKRAVRWVLLFGLTPLAILQAVRLFELNFVQTVSLLALYFCLFWALYFYSLIKPSRPIWKRAIGYASFTIVVGLPLLLIAQSLPIVQKVIAGSQSVHFGPRLLAFVFGVGLFEETCKAFPLLFFGLRKHTLRGTREGLFLGLMCGLGFAAVEGVGYTFDATVKAAQGNSEGLYTAQILQMVFRFMSGPVLHAAWAGTTGWFIGVASTAKTPRWPIVAVGIAFTAVLHGAYDASLRSPVHVLIAGVSFLTFMAYLAHGEAHAVKPSLTAEP